MPTYRSTRSSSCIQSRSWSTRAAAFAAVVALSVPLSSQAATSLSNEAGADSSASVALTATPDLALLTTPGFAFTASPATALSPMLLESIDKPKSRGVGGLVTGSILVGVGLSLSVICGIMVSSATKVIDDVNEDWGDDELIQTSNSITGAAKAIAITPGLLMVATGTPFLIVGAVRMSRYKKWQSQHQASLVPQLRIPQLVAAAGGSPESSRRGMRLGLNYGMRF